MPLRNRWVWSCTLILPLAIACGGSNATNTRNGEGLDDESARVGTNAGPGGSDREREAGNNSAPAIGSNERAGSVGTTGAAADRPIDGQVAGNVQAFVAAMLGDGQSEVALGRLAVERAANAQVKAFARQVADDHAKGNDELAAIASRMNVKAEPPDAAHQSAQDRLSSMKGADFDREFINTMITSHQHAVDQLKAMSGGEMPSHHEGASGDRPSAANPAQESSSPASDVSAVHAWAAKTTPIVQRHLDRARELQRTTAARKTQ